MMMMVVMMMMTMMMTTMTMMAGIIPRVARKPPYSSFQGIVGLSAGKYGVVGE